MFISSCTAFGGLPAGGLGLEEAWGWVSSEGPAPGRAAHALPRESPTPGVWWASATPAQIRSFAVTCLKAPPSLSAAPAPGRRISEGRLEDCVRAGLWETARVGIVAKRLGEVTREAGDSLGRQAWVER